MIVTCVAQLQLPRQLVLNGAGSTLAAEVGALQIASVALLVADHKSISIDEQTAGAPLNADASSPGSCVMQRQEVSEREWISKA